jgi:hypothetical protein
MLTYVEGMSNAQVAEVLGTSVSAVETPANPRQAEPAPHTGGVIRGKRPEDDS